MNLEKILGGMRKYNTPFDFSEIAEGELIQYARERFTAQQQIDIEQAISTELKKVLKKVTIENTVFTRQKSRRTYRQYAQQYYSRFHKNYQEVNEQEIKSAVLSSKLIYVGDFHPLKEPKTTTIKIAETLFTTGELTVCIESILQQHQGILNKYLKGELDSPKFVPGWYKPEKLFATILEFARKHYPATQILAIGQDSEKEGDFSTSDKQTALQIAKNLCRHPMLVLVGDYHIAPNHLPLKVRKIAGNHPEIVIYQNNTALYWHMRRTTGKCASAVKLNEGEYCIFDQHVSPLVKRQAAIDEIMEDAEFEGLTAEQKVSKILATTYLCLLLDNPEVADD